jgi:hypothetical protein
MQNGFHVKDDQLIADRAKWLLDPMGSMERLELELEHVILDTVAKDGKLDIQHVKDNLNERMEELKSYGLIENSIAVEMTNGLTEKKSIRFILLKRDSSGRTIPHRMKLSLTYE